MSSSQSVGTKRFLSIRLSYTRKTTKRDLLSRIFFKGRCDPLLNTANAVLR